MKINCLLYLLDLWKRGHRFVILTNEDHYIGVNNKKIFELGDSFKKDLINGYSLRGADSFIPIEIGGKERIKRIFNLDEEQYKILENYFENTNFNT